MEINDVNFIDIDNCPVALQFYMTQHCNLACSGCYMGASPNVARAVIPSADIDFYLRDFKSLNQQHLSVVFSGGEIFTLPTQYLEHNIQNALNHQLPVQLKTNGTWVDTRRAGEIFDMLGRLRVPQFYSFSDAELRAIIQSVPKWKRAILPKSIIKRAVVRRVRQVPALSMAVSVDNKIHPAKSVDWFYQIASRVGRNPNLSRNIALKTFTFDDNIDFINDRLLMNDDMDISDVCFENGRPISCCVRAARIEMFFGPFMDTALSHASGKIGADNLLVCDPNGDRFFVIYFYPDGTAGTETDALHSVGRVPYKDAVGRYKGIKQLRSEILQSVAKQRAC